MSESNHPAGEIILYQTEDGQTKLEVRLEDETVWLTQQQLATLLQTSKQNIGQHLKNIFAEGELDEFSVVKKFFTTAADGKNYQTNFYNLDAIISVGYRVKSHVATRFRQWATRHLREYIIKGFILDDERLKRVGEGNYFDELLARIRDIRSSEKVFWRKVLDIYATSIDYDPNTETSRRFFALVQNKMHWAAHGHTAAEIVSRRADAKQPNMGLTSWSGEKIRKADVSVAKNYLTQEELDTLNRIVTIYLEFAELQALNRKPMYMSDWIAKLDDFLRISDRDVLTHAGAISHQEALAKAHAEYEKYRRQRVNAPSLVEQHFLEAVNDVKEIEKLKRQREDD
ncbi:MAG TPA: cell filamentation protein Fic [Anaerolineae bacterium]|nr:cell filamentation protein Fic [Anaerolineae bacterium]HIP70078.1 cell filamentation protein Fic [Anaerolineae bacterium]